LAVYGWIDGQVLSAGVREDSTIGMSRFAGVNLQQKSGHFKKPKLAVVENTAA